jgi:hypothetical protein
MIQDLCRENLLALAVAYMRATGLSMATVSRRVHGTDTFLEKFGLRRCSITLRKFDEMCMTFAEIWPAEAPWPKVYYLPPPMRKAAKTRNSHRRTRRGVSK